VAVDAKADTHPAALGVEVDIGRPLAPGVAKQTLRQAFASAGLIGMGAGMLQLRQQELRQRFAYRAFRGSFRGNNGGHEGLSFGPQAQRTWRNAPSIAETRQSAIAG